MEENTVPSSHSNVPAVAGAENPLAVLSAASALPASATQVGHPAPKRAKDLSKAQKAAIVVQLLSQSGQSLSLGKLGFDHQFKLAKMVSSLGVIDKATVAEVVQEFTQNVESIGLTTPGDLTSAIDALEGMLNPQIVAELRLESGEVNYGDPWSNIAAQADTTVMNILERESVEVCAVVLSKLPTKRSAKLLEQFEGHKSRLIVLTMLELEGLSISAAHRIGSALSDQLKDGPKPALRSSADTILSDILSYSGDEMRQDILTGISEYDDEIAKRIADNIFTMQDLPKRLRPEDINIVCSSIDADLCTKAFQAANESGLRNVVNFMFDNMAPRLSKSLREHLRYAKPMNEAKKGEAMRAFIGALEALNAEEKIALIMP